MLKIEYYTPKELMSCHVAMLCIGFSWLLLITYISNNTY